jgi:hypothetical protein
VGNPEGKRLLVRLSCMYMNNIELGLKEIRMAWYGLN